MTHAFHRACHAARAEARNTSVLPFLDAWATAATNASDRSRVQGLDLVLRAAIASLDWALDDWRTILDRYNDLCRGTGNPLAVARQEDWFRIMVRAENLDACRSFETWAKRAPFFHPETRIRLTVGDMFPWVDAHGERLLLTASSFRPADAETPEGRLIARTTPKNPKTTFRLVRLVPNDLDLRVTRTHTRSAHCSLASRTTTAFTSRNR